MTVHERAAQALRNHWFLHERYVWVSVGDQFLCVGARNDPPIAAVMKIGIRRVPAISFCIRRSGLSRYFNAISQYWGLPFEFAVRRGCPFVTDRITGWRFVLDRDLWYALDTRQDFHLPGETPDDIRRRIELAHIVSAPRASAPCELEVPF